MIDKQGIEVSIKNQFEALLKQVSMVSMGLKEAAFL